MNAEQLFLREGADYFGNRLIYRNQDVGVKSSSGLTLNADGEAHLARLSDITDVEVKPKATRAPKAKKAEEPAEPLAEASLEDLLGD